MLMRKLKIIAKVIAIIIICLIGFVGIYLPWQKPLQMNNIIKDYSLGKDFTGYREIMLEVSDASKVLDSNNKVIGDTDTYDDSSISSNSYKKSEEKVNSEEKLNEDNYEKSKSIIEKRLKDLKVQDYNLSMNKESGKIYMQIPENNTTDKVVSNITEIGGVELKDSEDNTKVLLTTERFKKARAFYGTDTTGTAVGLELTFDKQGNDILKELSENEYKTIEESDDENSENKDSEGKENENADEQKSEEKETEEKDSDEEEKKAQKTISLYISGFSVTKIDLDDAVKYKKIQLRIGQESTDYQTIQDSYESAKAIEATLNNGIMPLKYKVTDNKYVQSEIKTSTIKNIIIAISVIFAVLLIYMIIKFKLRGVLATLSYLGFVSLYTIILRLFNVPITMDGIIGGIIILSINYIVNMKLINIREDEKKYYQIYLDIIMKLIPVIAISIAFVFMPVLALSSIGMAMFWGIAFILAYNITITRRIIN